MSLSALPSVAAVERAATRRTYLMCPPTEFAVTYAINPWMDPTTAVDRDRALAEWEALRATYLALGHEVHVVDAVPGLPDMVFAANGGLVVEGRALGARFAHPEREAEGPAYQAWFDAAAADGLLEESVAPVAVNEGQGDFLLVGDLLLAGAGTGRTDRAAHAEVQELFGLPVVSLTLVDPRYYHLDTALAVLDDSTVAYYPGAFSRGSRQVLRRLFPDAVLADDEDAAVLGLNAVSDGRTVVLSQQASGLIAQLRGRGFEVRPVDTTELRRAGGSARCCTLEVRA